MKKKLFVIIPIVVIVASVIGVYLIKHREVQTI